MCLAHAEWLQHCGLPPLFEFQHINGPDCLRGGTAGPAFTAATASLAYFLQALSLWLYFSTL